MPKKNRCERVPLKPSFPDTAGDAYWELRKCRFGTLGLDIFLKRGMLEWLAALAAPSSAASWHMQEASAEASRDELVSLLANMMEVGKHGAQPENHSVAPEKACSPVYPPINDEASMRKY